MILSNTNISIMMVRNCLRYPSTSLGTLCGIGEPFVNIWSKWKPVSSPVVTMTAAELVRLRYGLQLVQNGSSPLSLRNQAGTNGVIYNKPTGGANSPYRLGDFRNHNTAARIPVGTSIPEGEVVVVKKGSAAIGGNNYYTFHGGIESQGSATEVGVDDLLPPEALYKGILLVNGNTSYWCTGDDRSFAQVNWNNSQIRNWLGDIQAFEFYTNRRYSSLYSGDGKPYGDMTFFAMPTDSRNINPYTLRLTNEFSEGTLKYRVRINATATYVAGRYEINYKVEFSAMGSEYTGGQLSNIIFHLLDMNNNLVGQASQANYYLLQGASNTYTGVMYANTSLLVFKVFESYAEQASTMVLTEN